jgi:pyruvate,water dikinase
MQFATAEERAAGGRLVRTVDTAPSSATAYSLTDAEVIELARYALIIEEPLRPPDGHRVGQGRHRRPALHPAGPPETVKSQAAGQVEQRYRAARAAGTVLAEGRAIGQKIGAGRVRLVTSLAEMEHVQPGRRARRPT